MSRCHRECADSWRPPGLVCQRYASQGLHHAPPRHKAEIRRSGPPLPATTHPIGADTQPTVGGVFGYGIVLVVTFFDNPHGFVGQPWLMLAGLILRGGLISWLVYVAIAGWRGETGGVDAPVNGFHR